MVRAIELEDGDLLEKWSTLSLELANTTSQILGSKSHKSDDWYDENNQALTEAIAKHRAVLRLHQVKQVEEHTYLIM
ncbi:jg14955 [Pararge aegeria aegeria]|uniref:Jg14955 protein n=1 Tax=Pararge aegeria aegeria TaxID=348720 RepID=A0A8S4SI71_9NEOP|nr:jg14955 [Pararge aegeria aegeria]